MINAQFYMEWSARNDMSKETCWTFIDKVLREDLAIELPTLRNQKSILSQEKEFIKQQQLNGDWSEISHPKSGDVVLLLIGGNRPHVGVMIDNNKFLHFSESDKTVRLGLRNSIQWRNRVEGFYRHCTCNS